MSDAASRDPDRDSGTEPTAASAESAQPVITRDQVRHLARLVRISLPDEELDQLAPQLDDILRSVAAVSEVAADDVPPMSHPLPLTNVFRPDEVRPSLSPADALAAAPASEQQRFRVPQILGED